MSAEFDAAGAAAIGGLSAGGKADLSGQPCQNCGAVVIDRFCGTCGQLAASFHRPFWALIGETISDTLSLDGRLVRTLPTLLFRPGILTKAYTSGKRARYVPPFRLFLLASVVFYLSLFTVVGKNGWITGLALGDDANGELIITQGDGVAETLVDGDGIVDREAAMRVLAADDDIGENSEVIVDRVATVFENKEAFQAELEKWAPRLSVLLVPMTIFMLTLLHFWRRKLYVYDHAVHALHLHSWMYLGGTAVILLAPIFGGVVGGIFAISFLVYVWRSLAVASGSGWFMSLLRLLILLIFWIIVVAVLVLAAILISGLAVEG